MDRPHPIQYVTLVLAFLAAIFAFVAMRTADEARSAAEDARAEASFAGGNDASFEVLELQRALIRAGLIEDPSVIPVDQGTVDGPWARCLTEVERATLVAADPELDLADVELHTPCSSVSVELVEECPEPVGEIDEELGAVDEVCEVWYLVDGERFSWGSEAHPADVEAAASEWFLAEGDDGVDRVARSAEPHGQVYLHLTDEGWLDLVRLDWD